MLKKQDWKSLQSCACFKEMLKKQDWKSLQSCVCFFKEMLKTRLKITSVVRVFNHCAHALKNVKNKTENHFSRARVLKKCLKQDWKSLQRRDANRPNAKQSNIREYWSEVLSSFYTYLKLFLAGLDLKTFWT
jgi:hypothetical protein